MSTILSLVGHIQLTNAPPQEQLETISSSRLMWGTFLLSFKGVTFQSTRSETEKSLHDEMFLLKPREDILPCGTRSGLFFKGTEIVCR